MSPVALRPALLALLLLGATPAPAPLPEQAGDAIPAEALQHEAMRVSQAYFAAKDRGDYKAAYALIDADMRSYLSFDLYRAEAKRFNRQAGKAIERRVVRLTWERDPPAARRPGLYVAADFVSRFADIRLHCGYLMWRQQPDGAFRLVREEQNFLDEAAARRMPPEQLSAMPARLGCPMTALR